ncbi:MAG: alanine racemase [Gammaproteobacteria bacterium]|jgi:alanine racemase|nr:alanine racemase [Gammaproteobacteria bacterium]
MVSATIDTGALRHNLQVVRQWAPRSRVMAVIKANAYGHGLVSVARALESADAFAVARVDEGLTLRQAGIKAPTVLLEGVFDRDQLDAAAAAGFELVVHTPEQIQLLRQAPTGMTFKVWLKLDTGMNRLGFKGAAFGAALEALNGLAAVRAPVNLFTHLASADLPDLPSTGEQLALFSAATASLPGERSIANSAGMLGFGDAQADWVRPGLLLYGASPFAGAIGADYGLRPAMTLHSHIIAVKTLEVGEHVGYGAAWVAKRPTLLAVAAVGYGDGYPRSLASGSPVLVNGERVPLAGRVSMDMIGIDVSGMRSPPKLGDPVILWGEGLPVEEIAVWADTIPYELLCGISQRVAVTLR